VLVTALMAGAALAAAAPAGRQAQPAPVRPSAAAEVGPAEAMDPAAATRAYLERLSPGERARSDAYFEGGTWLQLWGFLYGLGVAWLLLAPGLSSRMRDLAERLTRFRPVQTVAYVVPYVVLTAALAFPLTVYQDFVREHRYGLATQGFGGWMRDQLIGLGVGLVAASLLLVPLYAVLRRARRAWWLWGSGVAVAFLALTTLVGPVYVAPLFNDYTPLADPEVKGAILRLARANGVPADDVYEFDASRQSRRISANVSGLLGTMRISLNDNLLERCSLPEIEAVMAHEIGHYVLNHVTKGILFYGLVVVAGFAFVRWSFERIHARRGTAWGIRGIDDLAGLPLLAALLSVFLFLATPLINTWVRAGEAEADIFGLNAAGQPEGFAEVALKLSEYRKLDPGPLEEWIFFDHPSGRARIEMAMRWRAQHPRRECPEGSTAAAGGAGPDGSGAAALLDAGPGGR
jgi:Zn-dependent protease with chaperone function